MASLKIIGTVGNRFLYSANPPTLCNMRNVLSVILNANAKEPHIVVKYNVTGWAKLPHEDKFVGSHIQCTKAFEEIIASLKN